MIIAVVEARGPIARSSDWADGSSSGTGDSRMSDDPTDAEIALLCAIGEGRPVQATGYQKHARNLIAGQDAVRLRAGERSLIG